MPYLSEKISRSGHKKEGGVIPWKVAAAGSRCPAYKPFAVVRADTGALVACHATEESAKKQLAALYANEKK